MVHTREDLHNTANFTERQKIMQSLFRAEILFEVRDYQYIMEVKIRGFPCRTSALKGRGGIHCGHFADKESREGVFQMRKSELFGAQKNLGFFEIYDVSAQKRESRGFKPE